MYSKLSLSFQRQLKSSARFSRHVIVFVPVSAEIYLASVELCVTVNCLTDVHIIGCREANKINPETDRRVSRSAAYSESVYLVSYSGPTFV